MADDDYLLDEVWDLYFHDPKEASWTIDSYVRLVTVSSARDYKSMREALRGKMPHGMFFLMREQVFPCWDDKLNIDGGCVSLKVTKCQAEEIWDMLCIRMLSETLQKKSGDGADECQSLINGISISPKSIYCVIKIWMSEGVRTLKEEDIAGCLDLPEQLKKNMLFRFNRDVIGWSQTRAQLNSPALDSQPQND